ncbi:MAG: alpha/beta hydrolase, partial [Actinomycetota bacterium]|nr:alpha/beta hydrolase [Actinomycetota bacterium]
SQWWDEGVFEALIPDDHRRQEVEHELPNVPLAFFQSPVEVPTAWCTTPGAYVLLSEAYRRDAARASLLGWPLVERLGSHLDIVNHESSIADILSRRPIAP